MDARDTYVCDSTAVRGVFVRQRDVSGVGGAVRMGEEDLMIVDRGSLHFVTGGFLTEHARHPLRTTSKSEPDEFYSQSRGIWGGRCVWASPTY